MNVAEALSTAKLPTTSFRQLIDMKKKLVIEPLVDDKETVEELQSAWKGPRNLPKREGKKFRRHRQTQARKRNRGAYSGQ